MMLPPHVEGPPHTLRHELGGSSGPLYGVLSLQSNNDRLRLLLDVTNKLVSNLELRDLLRAVSQDVRRVMRRDYDALSLP
jgi:hypothetical protein